MTLPRLEWVGIVAPMVFLALYHFLLRGPLNGLLRSPWGLLLLIASLSVLITVFSGLIFRAIARLQRHVEDLSRVAATRSAQLRALNETNLALSQERLVSSVLQRVVDLSRELVRSRYAAMSVVDEDGQLKAFLTSGVEQETRQAIGAPPSGKGLLGLMLQRAEPLRLSNMADHPASVGVPPGRPARPERSCLPFRVAPAILAFQPRCSITILP